MVNVNAQAQAGQHRRLRHNCAATGLDRFCRGKLRRQFVGCVGRKVQLDQRVKGNAKLNGPRRTVNHSGCGDNNAASRFDRGNRFTRRQASGHDIFNHEDLSARRECKSPAQRKNTFGAFHKHGINAERAAHFMADDDPAHGGRNDRLNLVRSSRGIF